jgi:soluble lytic murein transglycosylase-like protein
LPSHARSTYECRDYAGNTYRLPTPLADSAAMVCATAPEPQAPSAPQAAALERDAVRQQPLWTTERWRAAAAPRPAPRARAGVGRRAAAQKEEPTGFDPVLHAAAERYGHDVNLLKAIVYVESGFNSNAVSPKGAIGLMQVMPATARDLGLTQPMRELFDPVSNVDVGARYLRRLLDTFTGRPELAIAAYNAGENAVARYGNSVPPFPETMAYVEKVRARYIHLRERDASLRVRQPLPAPRFP